MLFAFFSSPQIHGTILAARNPRLFPPPTNGNTPPLLLLRRVHNLVVSGGGRMDGSGDVFWPHAWRPRPAILLITNCNNVTIRNVRLT